MIKYTESSKNMLHFLQQCNNFIMQPVFISTQIRTVLIRTDMHTSKTYKCCTSASTLYVL